MKTVRITGYSGCELSHTFDSEATGPMDSVILSPDNEGVVFGVTGVGGNDDIPGVKEKLVETFTVPADVSVAVKESLVESFIVPQGGYAPATPETLTITLTAACNNSDDFLIGTQLNSVPVAITAGDTPEQAAAKIRAATVAGWTLTGEGAQIIMTCDTVGNNIIGAFISEAGTGVYPIQVPVKGTYEGGSAKEYSIKGFVLTGFHAGSINVFYNSATPVAVSLAGTENEAQIIAAIAAADHTGYSVDSISGMYLQIQDATARAHAIGLSVADVDSGLAFESAGGELGVDPVEQGGIVPGNISVFYNSASATLVALTGLEATSADVADKIVLAAPIGYNVSTIGSDISIEKTVAGANAVPLSISFGTTGVTEDVATFIAGADRVGAIVPGNISVFYNIAGASLVPVTRDMLPSDIADAIVALAPATYTVANDAGAVSIEKKVIGGNAIPLSISFGDTGVLEDVATLTPGADLIHGGGAAKATSFKVQYSIDTRSALNSGTARFADIETVASGSYKQYVLTHPVSALRFDVVTAASDSTINLVLKTAK